MLEQIFAVHWPWIIAGILIAGLEILVPGIFLLWVGLGALSTGLLLLLLPDMSLAWQLVVFATAMLSSISLGFYVQNKSRTSPNAVLMNRELLTMIGHRYVAITDFHTGTGRIRVGDSSYTAVSDDEIKSGDTVKVTSIDGNKIRVNRPE